MQEFVGALGRIEGQPGQQLGHVPLDLRLLGRLGNPQEAAAVALQELGSMVGELLQGIGSPHPNKRVFDSEAADQNREEGGGVKDPPDDKWATADRAAIRTGEEAKNAGWRHGGDRVQSSA